MSVIGTAPVCVERLLAVEARDLVTIRLPGLKPSARLWSVGSIGLPARFAASSRQVEVQPPAVARRRVRHGEVVVRPRVQADDGSRKSQRSAFAVSTAPSGFGFAGGARCPRQRQRWAAASRPRAAAAGEHAARIAPGPRALARAKRGAHAPLASITSARHEPRIRRARSG